MLSYDYMLEIPDSNYILNFTSDFSYNVIVKPEHFVGVLDEQSIATKIQSLSKKVVTFPLGIAVVSDEISQTKPYDLKKPKYHIQFMDMIVMQIYGDFFIASLNENDELVALNKQQSDWFKANFKLHPEVIYEEEEYEI